MADTQPLPRMQPRPTISVGHVDNEDSDPALSRPAVRMGDDHPPPCPDWFAWWLKNEFRPFQREMRRQLSKRKVLLEVGKPIVYGGAALAAAKFPALQSLVAALLGGG